MPYCRTWEYAEDKRGMKQIPFNPMPDGTCRTIKSQCQKTSFANFIRGGGYAATGVAVLYDSRADLEEQAERNGL